MELKKNSGWQWCCAAMTVFALGASAFADGSRLDGGRMDGGRGRPGVGFDRRGGEFHELKRKARMIDELLDRVGPGIERGAAMDILRDLDGAIYTLEREAANNPMPPGPGPGPFPPGPFPPGPGYGPSCDLVGSGAFNGWTYNYRISVNGSVLVGTNDFNDLLTKLRELQAQRVCSVNAAQSACAAGGSGAFAGWTYNYRMMVNNTAIAGSNSADEMIRQYGQLRDAGVCRMVSYDRCQLLGSGPFAGWTYSNRVAIGGTVVDGANSLEQALAQMNKLRAGGLCQ